MTSRAGLHPAPLTNHGLEAALESLAARATLPVALDQHIISRPNFAVEVAAYCVVSEALANIARYARADSARITVADDARDMLGEVRDDGVGGADPSRGSGLQGLADRVGALGGSLAISGAHGCGTVVRAHPAQRRMTLAVMRTR